VLAVAGQTVPQYYDKRNHNRLKAEGFDISRLIKAHMVVRKDYVVPEDHIYVVGDNPVVSEDSRDFGPIPINCVWGRVVSLE